MPNWKNILEKQNAAAYAWPKGWTSRDDVADQLECSPERVASLLAPGIRAGSVERQDFTVWDAKLKRLVRITGYRETDKSAPPAPAASQPQNVTKAPPAGSKVVSRRNGRRGVVDKAGRVLWDGGRITHPTASAWRKGDIKLV
jgi:hypothetical protein